jgi:uncharacterized protein YxeA
MKKILKYIIITLIIILGGYFIIKTIKPIDDTKKLYISCNSNSKNYKVLSGNSLTFSKNDNDCNVKLEVKNVDRTYLKLKADKYFYKVDGNGKIDLDSIGNDIFVEDSEQLVLYGYDQKTKFIFEYK